MTPGASPGSPGTAIAPRLAQGQPAQGPVFTDEALHESVGWGCEQAVWRVGLDDPALPHEHDAVAHPHRLVDIVGDDDHGLLEPAQDLADLFLKPVAGDGVHGAEGFVHEEHVRVRRQGAGDADALALAA